MFTSVFHCHDQPLCLERASDGTSPIAHTIIPGIPQLWGCPCSDWETANVCPVFKKGERYNAENYRPISLTSIPCKLLEHILVSKIMAHCEEHQILCTEQHGFRKGRSCETQLLGFVDEVSEALEQGYQEDLLVFDFSKVRSTK
ncbi:uncharacterized protein LOC143276409 [Babylonia areolata]|uniref:uncharacterized protein LOC143276409 n=1 Tax=Babylonia areolata TaxID=304850 RepID=UPI003FD42FB7